MTEADLKHAREELFAAFLRLLEASWSTVPLVEINDAADAMDDAVGALVDALRAARRP